MFAAEKRAVVSRLSPNLYEIFGSAAVGFISVLPPGEVLAHVETVGRTSPELTVEVVDGADTVVPAGTIGHLRCRGPGVSGGLYGDASGAAAAEGFRDGWYYPGDVGTRDALGYIRLSGRLADLTRRNGIDIFMPEIEGVFQAHESVVEAAAVGVQPQPGGPIRLVVFVVPRGQPQNQSLAAHCRATIPAAKFPDRLFFAQTLPKTPNGKVDRRALAGMALRAIANLNAQGSGTGVAVPPTRG
jgi:acyl-coenzyme A synthetase/AMP-(fatty) acid ligase